MNAFSRRGDKGSTAKSTEELVTYTVITVQQVIPSTQMMYCFALIEI
jgi:hypothetical protein